MRSGTWAKIVDRAEHRLHPTVSDRLPRHLNVRFVAFQEMCICPWSATAARVLASRALAVPAWGICMGYYADSGAITPSRNLSVRSDRFRHTASSSVCVKTSSRVASRSLPSAPTQEASLAFPETQAVTYPVANHGVGVFLGLTVAPDGFDRVAGSDASD